MTAAPAAGRAYYLPQPSHWPITGACALLLTTVGAATWINRGAAGPYILAAGAALLVYMLFGWFGTVIRESEAGLYNKQVDRLVSLGDGLVHLLGDDVLRGILRRAVLHALARRAGSRIGRHQRRCGRASRAAGRRPGRVSRGH